MSEEQPKSEEGKKNIVSEEHISGGWKVDAIADCQSIRCKLLHCRLSIVDSL
jgi:hypothetical protein